MPEVPDWEAEHLAWQLELQNKYNKELPEEFTKGKTTYEAEDGEGGTQQWQPASRETEADVAMDTKSLRRRLDRRLFLLVKSKGKYFVLTCDHTLCMFVLPADSQLGLHVVITEIASF